MNDTSLTRASRRGQTEASKEGVTQAPTAHAPSLELRHLRYFITVAEELHFGRAAQRLGIAQPPLSQQIQRIERLLGYSLFVRTPKVALTDAARVLLPRARRLLAQAGHALEETARAARGERGRLTVGFAASAMLTRLPNVFRTFRQRYPGVRLVLRELSTRAQMDALISGTIDAGFLREPGEYEGIVAEPVLREPFVIVLPPGHALRSRRSIPLDAFADDRFVLFPRTVAPRLYDQVMSLCRSAGFEPRQVQEAQEWLTIVSLVDAGLGVSIAPASFQRLRWGDVTYHRVRPQGTLTTLALCRYAGEPTPQLAAFLSLTREELPRRR